MADQLTAPGGPAPTAATQDEPTTSPNILTIFLNYVGEIAILIGQAFRFLIRGRIDWRDLITQMEQIGVNSIPVALLTALASGAVISLYFTPFLKQYGVQSLSGGFTALAVSRELIPVLTGVVMAARAGSAIAAELGTMKVTEQIDALRSLAVSPVQYLVVPRLLASLIMVPAVAMLGDVIGIFGGFLVAHYMDGVPGATFPDSIRQQLVPRDFYMGLIKTVVFGLILAIVGCHQGLKTRGGATEVGQATTNAVVISIVLIYISNFVMAYVMFPDVTTL
jgi:phospholipid/cholesterol/gamma-HCH transport system permease protein